MPIPTPQLGLISLNRQLTERPVEAPMTVTIGILEPWMQSLSLHRVTIMKSTIFTHLGEPY